MKFSDIIFDYLDNVDIESSKDFQYNNEVLKDGYKVDEYEIKTDEESKKYNKPKGKYKLLNIPSPLDLFDSEIEYSISIVESILKKLIGDIKSSDRILVVGLGNRHISSDSLGTKVVSQINITINNKHLPKVMAIAPSVMGLTGIETYDIVEGVVSNVKPTHLILIDSLCASAYERLGKSIQITNTGICPGSGIGNKRRCIDRNIAPNVFSVGIPLLIYSSTFVSCMLEKYNLQYDDIVRIYKNNQKIDNSDIRSLLKNLKDLWEDDSLQMIVSLKDIEECVEILAKIISSAINKVLGVS